MFYFICIFIKIRILNYFVGLCYAEFGSRVPRAGSAYVYSYVSVGEFIAFIIGWNLVLEYVIGMREFIVISCPFIVFSYIFAMNINVIGTASVARGYSGYLDSLIDNAMQNAFRRAMPIDVQYLATYPDFFAFAITFLLARKAP